MQNSRTFTLFGLPITHPINVILLVNFLIQIVQYTVHLGEVLSLENWIYSYFSLIPLFFWEHGSFWQCFTYGFLHSTNGLPLHFLFNMYALFLFGKPIVRVIGNVHFTGLYLVSLIGGGITIVFTSFGRYLLTENITVISTPTLGASAAIFGLILVFGNLFPNVVFELLFFPIPIKAEYLLIVSILAGLALTYIFNLPISNEGHIGGAIFGGIYYLLFLRNHKAPSSWEYYA